jgi:transposase InsO family protein
VFIAKALDAWAYQKEVPLEFSRPGKPTDNAFAESFNGHFRAECLDCHLFVSLEEARQAIEACRSKTTRSMLIRDSGSRPRPPGKRHGHRENSGLTFQMDQTQVKSNP